MIKQDIVHQVIERTGLPRVKAEAAVETVFESMKKALAASTGTIIIGRISTLTEFDYQAVAIAAVDGFLKCFAKDPEIT